MGRERAQAPRRADPDLCAARAKRPLISVGRPEGAKRIGGEQALMKRTLASLLLLVSIPGSAVADPIETGGGAQDAVVVAIIDGSFGPYHFDYRASMMPQALNSDPGDDLPLHLPASEWLPGFPDPETSFASFESLELTLPTSPTNKKVVDLYTGDAAAWGEVKGSAPGDINMVWMPGTKVIGAMDFGSGQPHVYGDFAAHGTGTTSVGVGNIHGTCPECLLVFIGYDDAQDAQAALDWAHAQPWIDIVSNSWGINQMTPVTSAVGQALGSRNPGVTFRDQVYAGPIEGQRAASERGQSIVFSAGNGIENGFIVPHSTYTSSIKGPDWVITVGAVTPNDPHAAYSGAGKPVDVAGVGNSYPSAYNSTTMSGTKSEFSGTSNAAPTVAGTYARALYLARRDLGGPSRVQVDGVIATGVPFACGAARPDCELGDGVLTAEELRGRLLRAPSRTSGGTSPGGLASVQTGEEEALLQQGHGTFLARLKKNTASWLAEFDLVLAPLEGRAPEAVRTDAERDFMLVDSFCRQMLWGGWDGGYWSPGTTLPAADGAFPVRSSLATACTAIGAA